MGDIFRIYFKDLVRIDPGDPNDPLTAITFNTSSFWGEGTAYILGCGVKRWYDAICDPEREPEAVRPEGDSMKTLAPKAKKDDPDELIYPPSAFSSTKIMKPKAPYPKTRYTSSDFWWNPDRSAVTGDSVLIYCLRLQSDSLIAKDDKSLRSKLGGGGTTHAGANGTISEIYVQDVLTSNGIGNMQALINVAFHETMHNKLKIGQGLHADKGLAADRNMPDDTLNDTNIRKMRGALEQMVVQDTRFL
ncbi:hypothetical protein [Aquisphaera insulae]|uniref:hypothetical protein n=1 Tax=Aquisphaera insulae TaxID=2712864 RepID=UPI0013E9AF29|nr:hypothetical protein [Aquisphaera insulae]